jgi:hypothetical protein
MMEYLPNKSLKQIRDKRRELTFKALVEQYKATTRHSATPKQHDIICASSDSETESRLVPNRRYISETEDEVTSDQGQMSRQLSPSPPRTGQTSLAHRRMTELRQSPGLERLVGDGLPPSQTDVDDQEEQVTRVPSIVSGATEDLGSTTMTEQEWRNGIISQALATTPDNLTLSSKCRDLHSRLVSTLTVISDKQLLATQARVDDVYAQVLAQIETSKATKTSKRTRTKGPKTQTSRKRRKRYIYARTQDLFRKNPNLLARYIREGIS